MDASQVYEKSGTALCGKEKSTERVCVVQGKKGIELVLQDVNKEKNPLKDGLIAATGASTATSAIGLLQQHSSVVVANDSSKLVLKGDEYLCAMSALQPQDEIEGMLYTQILSLQELGMKHAAYAANTKNSNENIDRSINNAVKLLRLQHETLETLNRYRRKGAQQVIVQHVHVNDGGQAIVGALQQQGGGGLSQNKGSTP